MSTKSQAQLFKLLSSPTRLCILKSLIDDSTPQCVNSLSSCACTTHSNTSHQLKQLEDAHIVTSQRKGQEVCYSLADSHEAQVVTRILLDIT